MFVATLLVSAIAELRPGAIGALNSLESWRFSVAGDDKDIGTDAIPANNGDRRGLILGSLGAPNE